MFSTKTLVAALLSIVVSAKDKPNRESETEKVEEEKVVDEESFRPDDYYDFYDEHAIDDTEPHLDPLTRPPKCLGLALSDAMDIGPYQAGALIGLLKNGQKYEVITGVTMGALNAYILALHDKDEVEETIKELGKSTTSFTIIYQ